MGGKYEVRWKLNRKCPFCGQMINDHADDCYLRLFAVQIADSLMLGDVGMYAHVSREAVRTAWNARAERTCHYFPDSMQVAFDENDEEIETGEAYSDGCDYTCSACGFTMLGGEEGWFDETPGEYGGWNYKARFNYCPNCGAKVSE